MGIYANTNGTLTPLAGGGSGSGAEAYSLLEITFDAAFSGLTYTLYADSVVQEEYEIYTRTVPASLKDVVRVKQCNMRYVAECTVDSKQYTNSITTADYFGEYKMHLYQYHIYGARWDSDPSPVWERTDDAAEFTDPVPYVAGSENYGSPFDNIAPWSGMIVIPSYERAGECVAIPRFWYQLKEYGDGGLWIRISDAPIEGFEVSPAHRKHWTNDDSDYEREAVLVGRYLSKKITQSGITWCTSENNGSAWLVQNQYSDAQTYSMNTGTDTYPMDYDTFFTVWMLYLVEFADWRYQRTIGTPTLNETCGGAKDMPYHTGTMSANKTDANYTQYRYIENFVCGRTTWLYGISLETASGTSLRYHLRLCDDLSIRSEFALYDMAADGYRIHDLGILPVAAINSLNITKFKVIKNEMYSLFMPNNDVSVSAAETYSSTRMRMAEFMSFSYKVDSNVINNKGLDIYGYLPSSSSTSPTGASYATTRLLVRLPNVEPN